MERTCEFEHALYSRRKTQMQLDRSKSLKRPRLVAPNVAACDPPALLKVERGVSMMDMDFLPRQGEMTIMSDTGFTHVFRCSDRFLRVFLNESVALQELKGYENVVVCLQKCSKQLLRRNTTATGHFGSDFPGGVVHGNVVLLYKK